jgi:DNA-binding transcriptional MerR regulator
MLSGATLGEVASDLDPWRSRDDLTLDELVDAADKLLKVVAPKQTRYAVAERPDVRTIRYYTTRGLLPKPLSYDGGRARYGFAHLARLVAIKRMQAEHLTLEQIARALEGRSDDDVLPLLAPAPAPALATVPLPEPAPARITEARAAVAAAADLVLELSPGGRLVVTADVVKDAAGRARLAENLEALARMLRVMSEEQGGSR